MTSILPDGPALAQDPEPSVADAPAMARTDPRHGKPRRRYKIRGPETWALIRESYLAGAPARELAERYDVTEWNIWRRAWKGRWTKLDRAEPEPPPALDPVTPAMVPGAADDDPDPQALTRQALRGVASALRQNRLAEARNLSMIAASLERLGEGGRGGAGGGGGFTLGDMLRIIHDHEFRREIMTLTPGGPNPPEKEQYWERQRRENDQTGQLLAALQSRGYAEGRAELRDELGLAPEPEAPDHWVWHNGSMVRHSVVEEKREQARERQVQEAMRTEAAWEDEDA